MESAWIKSNVSITRVLDVYKVYVIFSPERCFFFKHFLLNLELQNTYNDACMYDCKTLKLKSDFQESEKCYCNGIGFKKVLDGSVLSLYLGVVFIGIRHLCLGRKRDEQMGLVS